MVFLERGERLDADIWTHIQFRLQSINSRNSVPPRGMNLV
jgi:hypothetical protein